MDENSERRTEKRLYHNCPVWFGENFRGSLSAGRMVDVSSRSMAFICDSDESYPLPGRRITVRFSVPRLRAGKCFNEVVFTNTGRIHRADNLGEPSRRVVIEFTKPLFFKPGHQDADEFDTNQKVGTIAV